MAATVAVPPSMRRQYSRRHVLSGPAVGTTGVGHCPGLDGIEFEVVVKGKTRELKRLDDEQNVVRNHPTTSVSAFENGPNTEV